MDEDEEYWEEDDDDEEEKEEEEQELEQTGRDAGVEGHQGQARTAVLEARLRRHQAELRKEARFMEGRFNVFPLREYKNLSLQDIPLIQGNNK